MKREKLFRGRVKELLPIIGGGLLVASVSYFWAGMFSENIQPRESNSTNSEQAPEKKFGDLESILARGKLVVFTRNAPTTYYWDAHNLEAGPEFDLIQAFSKYLGVGVEVHVKDTVNALIASLRLNQSDFLASALSKTKMRGQEFLFGPVYDYVTPQTVCHRKGSQPETISDLVDLNLKVPAKTSYIEHLTALKKEHPTLNWRVSGQLDTEDIMEQVNTKTIDCTVVDSNLFNIYRRYYPDLKSMFPLKDPDALVWVLPKQATALQKKMEDWFSQFKSEGKLETLLNKYYGHIENFGYVDTIRFHKHLKTRYPKYKTWFEEAGRKYGISPLILAAQAYQESKWNPRAKSPTGVRGIMMLTLTTSKEMGIRNRLDPQKSIFGGARYLAKLKERFKSEFQEPDLTWVALAAYNVGSGHIRDAQVLAYSMHKNPYKWKDLKTLLPLLQRKMFYKFLKFGYARGKEPVEYVRRIRNYTEILKNRSDLLLSNNSKKNSP